MNEKAATPGLEAISLYDTRRREVLPFAPLEPGRVGIYTCGPTVYAPQHLGNMRSQLTPDLLRRVLGAAGYRVTFVTNITDVGHLTDDADAGDDKMEEAALRAGRSATDIAAFYTEQWAGDRRRLGCADPDVLPRAAAHIPEQIEMIRTLEERGHAYVITDGVYFDISTFPAYAEFAHLELDDQGTTGRIDNLADKRHPADFALWKLTPPGVRRQQEWDSPWGRGFPGWHIECSAMATKYLGSRFDVHTGGVDHVGVHHTNEVAQSECALGVHPWVSFWVHTEFLDLAGAKMSKSAGHVLTVDTLVERGIDPLVFRYWYFTAHYRQKQAFSWPALEQAATAYRRLVTRAVECRTAGGEADAVAVDSWTRRFWEGLADDLNAPQALATIWELVRSSEAPATIWTVLADADRALGFGLSGAEVPDALAMEPGGDPRIDALVAERRAAREARDFATADAIRDRLAADGIEVIDTVDGTGWRRR